MKGRGRKEDENKRRQNMRAKGKDDGIMKNEEKRKWCLCSARPERTGQRVIEAELHRRPDGDCQSQ